MKEIEKIIIFKVGTHEYGIPISQVREIIDFVEVNKVPEMPKYISGIINIRGRLSAIFDLKAMFDIEDDMEHGKHIIITNENNCGIIVDSVDEIISVDSSEMSPLSSVISNSVKNCILGVYVVEDKVVIVLDVKKVLNSGDEGITDRIDDICLKPALV